jgi:hypothetical protein
MQLVRDWDFNWLHSHRPQRALRKVRGCEGFYTAISRFAQSQHGGKMPKQSEGWLTSTLKRVNRAVSEDMSDFDPDAEYDTRVKLPEWQLARLKARAHQPTKKVPDVHSSGRNFE